MITLKKRFSLLLAILFLCLSGCEGFKNKESGGGGESLKADCVRGSERIYSCTMIPRGKSVRVPLEFAVSSGRLSSFSATHFTEAADPAVDTKDFKYGLFTVEIEGIHPGGEVEFAVRSPEFFKATAYWIYNKNASPTWTDPEAESREIEKLLTAGKKPAETGHGAPASANKAAARAKRKTREMTIRVKDGGAFDSDGKADGRIVLVGGPKDSFWGYALGTLFIRFFGIFIVLIVLMAGMIASGKVFQRMEAAEEKKKRGDVEATEGSGDSDKGEGSAEGLSPEAAAAVAVALHMHFTGLLSSEPIDLRVSPAGPWTLDGRGRIMSERCLVFNRKAR